MFKRILVPVDGSDTSNKALTAALQMARDGGGRVRIVHVMEEPFLAATDVYGDSSGELGRAMHDNAARVLDAAMAIAGSAGVPADNALYDQPGQRVGEAVADAAMRWEADLVVVGTHGRRGIGRMLLGSGAEQVIRLAPVPVLVFRSAAA